MVKFSAISLERLESCDPKLQKVFHKVIELFNSGVIGKGWDCSILQGHRGKDEQNKYYNEGKSKVQYPDGRHNAFPSRAVDVTPYPIDFDDRERQTYFAGFVLGVAGSMGIKLRWGGDWDRDGQVADNRFDDMPHFELID
tara:strand:- start:1622 stop:2041 length:420 start_codon:yes stop_codon:yes gene_type:complete